MDQARQEIVTRLHHRLVEQAHPSGGWGYYAGKSPRIEPTCWALAALAFDGEAGPADFAVLAQPHLAFLAACQHARLLQENVAFPENLTANGLAATVLPALPSSSTGPKLPVLLEGIVAVKGVKIQQGDDRQDNSLQAWPWIPDTFSWAEPTAWCTVALKRSGLAVVDGAVKARIDEAEKVLMNRSCIGGGWNYGNGTALGRDLRAHVPTTALGLLAMQDRRSETVVAEAVAFLERGWENERTALATGLAAIALRTLGRPADAPEASVADRIERAERLGNLHALAVALCALSGERHQGSIFRLAA